MLALTIAIAGALLVLFYGTTIAPQQAAMQSSAQANAVAESLLSYRSSVIQYLTQNPAFTGTSIPDSSLTFQYGYQRNPAWTNYIVGHVPYVYSTMVASAIPVSPGTTAYTVSAASIVSAIYSMTQNSPAVGIVSSGAIVNPALLNNAFLPVSVAAAIPAGSLVIAGY